MCKKLKRLFSKRKSIYKNDSDIETITEALGELGDVTYQDIKDLEDAVAELGEEVVKLTKKGAK